MIIYSTILLTILCQTIPTYSFLLKCETVVEEVVSGPQTQALDVAVTPAVETNAAINTYDDYSVTSHGIHKFHLTAETWNSARNICLDEKAQLVVIDTATEEALIIKYMKDHNIGDMWIGVHDLFERNQWTTVTGERLYSLDYVHWRKNEPNNVGSSEHCADISQAGMNDLSCDIKLFFICEKTKLV